MYLSIPTLSLLLASAASALPLNEQPAAQCSNPRIRKEWYISGKNCSQFEDLLTTPLAHAELL